MNTINVVLDVPDWKHSVQAFLDKYSLAKPKKNEEFVDSKPEVVVHNDELQVVEESSEVEV